MRKPVIIALLFVALHAAGQKKWSVEDCMRYAIEHNHEVRKSQLALDNYVESRTAAVGSFLPSLNASIGTQYNFGRAIDPETNTYTNVSTFSNGYSVYASIPVFDGFGKIHALKAAKADVLMGKNALQVQRDQTALAVFQAYIDVLYYQQTLKMAEEKQAEADLIVRQAKVMEEVGRMSNADVSQTESSLAEAEYEVTRQQNLLSSAMLTLKNEMNYAEEGELVLVERGEISGERGERREEREYQNRVSSNLKPSETATFNVQRSTFNVQIPQLNQAYFAQQSALHQLREARSALYPSIYFGAGVNTSYYKTLHSHTAESYRHQLKNNMGEYISATISIPIFNRLKTITAIRKARNNYLIAQKEYEQKRTELEKLTMEAAQDLSGYIKEAEKCERKVAADSIAYALTKRQFEEGLSTAIDLKTASSALINSRAELLKSRLMIVIKERLLNYYKGDALLD